MASTAVDWTSELPPLMACKLVPKLPPLAELRAATDSAMELSGPGTSTPNTSRDRATFHSQQLYDAVLGCVTSQRGIRRSHHLPTALLITSVAMEEYVRSHSTRAKILAARQAHCTATAAPERVTARSGLAGGGPAGFAGLVGAADAAGSGGGRGGNGGAAGFNIDGDGDRVESGPNAELIAFLHASSDEEVADRLLEVLGEPEHMRTSLLNIVRKYDRNTLAGILQATLQAHVAGDNTRADGRGQKTLGGVFFRQVQKASSVGKQVLAQQTVPPLPPLRRYQRDVVGLVLCSWGLPLPPELMQVVEPEAAGGGGVGSVEELQQRCRVLSGGWTANWLVSAPTNSGKTRMFVEVVRGLLAARATGRCAVVVVLVPNVILTYQHKAYFDRAKLPGALAAAFSSDRPLSPRTWQEMVRVASLGPPGGRASVVVCTAESFANLLRNRQATMEQVDLLVLDEAHNCKDGHPYAQVMGFYGPEAAAGTRVLAVTASPASEKDQNTLFVRMEGLLGRLHAKLYVVYDRDPQLAAVVPEPRQIEAPVRMRPVDREFILVLQTFALNATMELSEALSAAPASWSRQVLVQQLDMAVSASTAKSVFGGQQGLVTRLDPIGQWLSKAREHAALHKCANLDLCCRFLDVMRKATELVEDAGFEGALVFIARKAATLCRDETKLLVGPLTRPPRLPAPPAATPYREVMLSAAAAAAAANAAGGAGAGTSAPSEPRILTELRIAAAAAPPSPREEATGSGDDVAVSGSCADISLRVSKLLKDLLVGEEAGGLLSTEEASDMVRDCFVSGELKEDTTFPKFWALMSYLQGYRGRETFHGIIFVKTRQAVFYVADMIRRTQQLQFLEVLELIGHNATIKRTSLASENDRHGRGMSDSEQQQVLQVFKAPGRKVLVATSAAEEGLDVPNCEFVVRYNAAATGIQLLQSRGRARRNIAEFFAILQEGTLDTDLHAKSRLEEANMRHYHRWHMEAEGALAGPQ